jgi:hypothetical protein
MCILLYIFFKKIKPRNITIPGHESCIVEKINLHNILVGSPKWIINFWEFMYK